MAYWGEEDLAAIRLYSCHAFAWLGTWCSGAEDEAPAAACLGYLWHVSMAV